MVCIEYSGIYFFGQYVGILDW